MTRRLARAVLVPLLPVLAGCASLFSDGASATPPATGPLPTPTPSDPGELTIFGAASLGPVLAAIEADYEAATGVQITIATDSSAALRTQILEGAVVDVFLSADVSNVQALVEANLTDDQAAPFAGNELAVIVPLDNPGGLTSPADLAKRGLQVIAAGEEVPITRYAGVLLANLSALDDYPDDLLARYAANVVSREDNVRAILAKIELGEADAAIVYATDAASSSAVATVPIPEGSNVVATYAGVILADAPNEEVAEVFFEWLRGPDGQAILADFGFVPVE